MKQILHIFAKDARHLWVEILISVGLTTALVFTAHHRWLPGMAGYEVTVSFSPRAAGALLPSLLTVLIPLSWWILISPAIHEERLVGDRQFWLTRPYEWKSLLAAKLLFIGVFIYVPLFVCQCLVLARAGFNPLSCLPGVAYNLVCITAVLILPLVALAAITRNFARMTLVILGVLVCLVAISALTSMFPAANIASPFADNISLALVLCACVLVIGVQYAVRRTTYSWLAVGITLVAVATLACAAPDQGLMNGRYPVAAQSAGLELTYPSDAATGPVASVARGAHDVAINVPIQVSGIAPGSLMIPEDLQVTLEALDGARWTSFWQPIYRDKFFPGGKTARASFAMPRSVYVRMKGGPLTAHIVLALERAIEGQTISVSMPLTEFQVPGFGICTPQKGFFYKPDQIGGIGCRSALRQPPLTFVKVLWTDNDCGTASEQRRNVQGEAWVGALDRPPADFAISPVWNEGIGFTNSAPDYHFDQPRHMCPGSPASFTLYQAAGRMHASLDIQHLVLPELTTGQVVVIDHN